MNKEIRNFVILLIVFFFSFSFSYININNYFKIEEEIIIKPNQKPKLEINKVLIIGDSRMELINNDKNNLGVPSNFIFKAQSGARITWLYQVGLPWLREQIKIINDNYNYIVLFNLGVNDLNSSTEVKELAKKYFDVYKHVIEKNKNITFYFLSVNRVDESVIEKYFPDQKRTNKKIESFNQHFIDKINQEKLYNVKYCDSYNTLNIKFYDGLHFDFNTNEKIIDYLINDCIKLNNFNTFSINNKYKLDFIR